MPKNGIWIEFLIFDGFVCDLNGDRERRMILCDFQLWNDWFDKYEMYLKFGCLKMCI